MHCNSPILFCFVLFSSVFKKNGSSFVLKTGSNLFCTDSTITPYNYDISVHLSFVMKPVNRGSC